MMNQETYTLLYQEAKEALYKKQLNRALLQIEGLLYNVTDWSLHTEFESIKQTYDQLLQFMRTGTKDPERESMFHQLMRRTHYLADELIRAYKLPLSSHPYYEKLRTLTKYPRTLAELQLEIEQIHLQLQTAPKGRIIEIQKRQESVYNTLFSFLWTAPRWKEVDYEGFSKFFNTTTPLIKKLAISALTLSIMEFFDPLRMQFLIEIYRVDDQKVRQRALVGAVLCLLRHQAVLTYHPQIALQLARLSEKYSLQQDLSSLQMQLMMSLETGEVMQKMRDEIIPDLLNNKRFKSTKFDFEETDDTLKHDNINPDWKEQEQAKQIDERLIEINEMQQEGIDLYMATFSQLKHFSFFNEIMNWFYPFDASHYELQNTLGGKGKPSLKVQQFLNSATLCDSDKYSFGLVIRGVPQEKREMIEDLLIPETQDEQADLYNEIPETAEDTRSIYIQDLYRFFKLYSKRSYFSDPFSNDLYFIDIPCLGKLLTDHEVVTKLADFMLRHKYYEDAIDLYNETIKTEVATAEILQKIGCAHQLIGNYKKAIAYYKQSDILKPYSPWTLRQLAHCYQSEKLYDEALKCHLRTEELDPENLQNLAKIGECYAVLEQYDQAFAYLFKVDYLGNSTQRSTRALAWCSFITQKLPQAEKYYARLLAHKPKPEDFLNAGHTAWAMGDLPLAINRYKKFLELSDQKIENLETLFDIDSQELVKYGITSTDLALMVDLLNTKSA